MLEILVDMRYGLVNYIDSIFGLGLEMSVWVILIFVMSVILLGLLHLILKNFTKKVLGIKKELIYQYDNIFYLLALSQYKQKLDKKSMDENSCIAAIKSIVNMDNPDYISQKDMIKSNIQQIELLLGIEVISKDIWDKINKFHKKLNLTILYYKISKILFIFILIFVISIFVYIFSV